MKNNTLRLLLWAPQTGSFLKSNQSAKMKLVAACLISSILFGCSKLESFKTLGAGKTEAVVKTKKVLIIGLDGTLWTALTQQNAPHIKALMDSSWVSTNAQAEPPTWSAGGWSGILTGTSISKHKATDNSFTGNDIANNPSFFREIKTALPNLRTGAIVAWSPITTYIVNANDVAFRTAYGDSDYVLRDSKVATAVINELSNNNPDVLFCHFDNIDHNGHGSGFSTSNVNYTNAIAAADVHVGNILTALKNRATYSSEDWLIVMVTDHGGTGTGHGGASYLERNPFIILNNSAITPAVVNTLPGVSGSHSENVVGFGNGAYGKLPALSNVDFATGNFTIEYRVRKNNTLSTNYPPVISNKNWVSGINVGFEMHDQMGKLRFNISNGTTRKDFDPGIDLTDQNWHYITLVINRTTNRAMVYEAGLMKLNGDISAVTGSIQDPALNLNIGQDGRGLYGPNLFNGNITHLRIFNTALSPATIAKQYQNSNLTSTNHPDYASLKYYAKGNDGSGSVYTGIIGGNVNLIGSGTSAPSWSSASAGNYVSGNPPFIYGVAPTVLKFLNVPIPARYDAASLVNF
ncbi:hypothetical protein CA265_18730 [Sphingobacteriaceae bacterium GW460-11-11-14-LB5]|nr:hypothetical protein CA265_18730 [Sphingobacteriaceae bacterium GW460-11-11-14-LB5]